MNNIITENLTEAENDTLSLNIDTDKFKTETDKDELILRHIVEQISETIDYDGVGPVQTDEPLSALAENNEIVAELLIRAVERTDDFIERKDEILEKYMFKEDDREDELQKKILGRRIKKFIAATGLSYDDLYRNYDLPKELIDDWLTGNKKISKPMYKYLEYIGTESIPSVQKSVEMVLPLRILSKEAIKYLMFASCAEYFKDFALTGEEFPEISVVSYYSAKCYRIRVENYEKFENGKVVKPWNDYKVRGNTKTNRNSSST